MRKNIRVGDVVQINPETIANSSFKQCFAIVSDVKEWGIKGVIPIPFKGNPQEAWIHLSWEEFERIGPAKWLPEL